MSQKPLPKFDIGSAAFDLLDLIKSRRSIRRFQDRNVPEEILHKIIEAGTWAPSACNMQDWRFVVVRDQKKKDDIFDYGGSIAIKHAPLCIAVCYDNRSDNDSYRDDIQSASLAMMNMVLMAHSLGLGGAVINHLPTKRQMAKILSLPSCFELIAVLVMGYPANEKEPVLRERDLRDFYTFDTFDFKLDAVSDPKKSKIRKLVRTVYFHAPKFIKMLVRPYVEKKVRKFKN